MSTENNVNISFKNLVKIFLKEWGCFILTLLYIISLFFSIQTKIAKFIIVVILIIINIIFIFWGKKSNIKTYTAQNARLTNYLLLILLLSNFILRIYFFNNGKSKLWIDLYQLMVEVFFLLFVVNIFFASLNTSKVLMIPMTALTAVLIYAPESSISIIATLFLFPIIDWLDELKKLSDSKRVKAFVGMAAFYWYVSRLLSDQLEKTSFVQKAGDLVYTRVLSLSLSMVIIAGIILVAFVLYKLYEGKLKKFFDEE